MALGGEYQFAAWSRSGIGALLGGTTGNVALDVELVGSIPRTLTPYGSGDVAALDRRAVVRTTPRDGVLDFEPNLFPSIRRDERDGGVGDELRDQRRLHHPRRRMLADADAITGRL